MERYAQQMGAIATEHGQRPGVALDEPVTTHQKYSVVGRFEEDAVSELAFAQGLLDKLLLGLQPLHLGYIRKNGYAGLVAPEGYVVGLRHDGDRGPVGSQVVPLPYVGASLEAAGYRRDRLLFLLRIKIHEKHPQRFFTAVPVVLDEGLVYRQYPECHALVYQHRNGIVLEEQSISLLLFPQAFVDSVQLPRSLAYPAPENRHGRQAGKQQKARQKSAKLYPIREVEPDPFRGPTSQAGIIGRLRIGLHPGQIAIDGLQDIARLVAGCGEKKGSGVEDDGSALEPEPACVHQPVEPVGDSGVDPAVGDHLKLGFVIGDRNQRDMHIEAAGKGLQGLELNGLSQNGYPFALETQDRSDGTSFAGIHLGPDRENRDLIEGIDRLPPGSVGDIGHEIDLPPRRALEPLLPGPAHIDDLPSL
jgi:hypothetical protein